MPGMLGRPFSFFPKRRPMDDLILFFLAALLRESWLLLLLLGLLPWPSWSPARLLGGGAQTVREGNKTERILSAERRRSYPRMSLMSS